MATTCKRILVDTNILLDFCDANRPSHDDAVALVHEGVRREDVAILASIGSYKDAYYILTRLYKDEHVARTVIKGLMNDAGIAPVDMLAAYGNLAVESDEPDFEDGLIRATAECEAVDMIATRDVAAYARSRIPHLDAAGCLKVLGCR